MKKFLLKYKSFLIGSAGCMLIAFVTMSFQDTPFVNHILDNQEEQVTDTVPQKTEADKINMQQLDEIILSMDDNMIMVGNEMKKIDLDLITKEVAASLKQIDIDNIMKEVEASLASIDLTGLMEEIKLSVNGKEWTITGKETQEALKEAEKGLAAAREELGNLNKDELRHELQAAMKEIENAHLELKSGVIDEAMKEAHKGIQEAKEELQSMRSMFTEMEKDGLIDRKEGFSIAYKNKELFINGKLMTDKVTDKYRKYLKKDHFKIQIEKE